MIVSPRAKPVTDIVRIAGGRLIEIDEVILLRRGKDGAYQKISYWKRGENNTIVGGGSCCCCNTSGSGGGSHKPCVILAEAEGKTAWVLNAEGKPTEEKIQLHHIIEKNNE